jgi:hypothetical protein
MHQRSSPPAIFQKQNVSIALGHRMSDFFRPFQCHQTENIGIQGIATRPSLQPAWHSKE